MIHMTSSFRYLFLIFQLENEIENETTRFDELDQKKTELAYGMVSKFLNIDKVYFYTRPQDSGVVL